MELSITISYLPLFQKQVLFLYQPNQFAYRDSDVAKHALEAFKALEKKHSKKISITSLNAKLVEESLLPMMVVQDKSSGEIITQLFGFVDQFPNKQQITLENVEKLMRIRELLEPVPGQQKQFEKKEELEHLMTSRSSYLKDQLNNDEVAELNIFLSESEKINELTLDPRTVNYKANLLESFKQLQDPFGIEVDDINFDQNPNDPSQLQMNIKFTNQGSQQ